MRKSRAPARRSLLRRILERRAVAQQAELVRLLAREGHRVTQATVSRDLAALGVHRIDGPDGESRYTLPAETGAAGNGAATQRTLLRQFVLQIDHSGNLAVLRQNLGSPGTIIISIAGASGTARYEF